MVRQRILNRFTNNFVNKNPIIRDFVNAWQRIEAQRLDIIANRDINDVDRAIMMRGVAKDQRMYQREIRTRISAAFADFLTTLVFEKARDETAKGIKWEVDKKQPIS